MGGDVKAQEGFADVRFQTELALERRFQQWSGEVGGALQIGHHLIDPILAGHMTGDEFAQFCVPMWRGVLETGRQSRGDIAQCFTPLGRCLAQPGRDDVNQVLKVGVRL